MLQNDLKNKQTKKSIKACNCKIYTYGKAVSCFINYRVQVRSCLNFGGITSAELTTYSRYTMRKKSTVNLFYICTSFLYASVISPVLTLEFLLLLIPSCISTAVPFMKAGMTFFRVYFNSLTILHSKTVQPHVITFIVFFSFLHL